ncbi:AAA family ATPase [Prescottella subtropica]|uniref:AAA family ATPase n=1 Tax=Prescottella subtropica TaxID=2545757 RepID=UPI0010F47AE4|nr:SMC family ATPase [Prescottella subtropica]
MRLHHLEVSAFGPFGDAVSVDFDELGADGLFLLHGRTGAGKTTILDAVAFALYGTVPGARRDGKRLLSDHAPAGAVPTVALEATVGGRRLRLTRSPEYERPKKRGAGTLTENAKATLDWLDGSGEPLSRIPDIAREVERMLGMTADQFFQVVLLPQGEFARFLRADNEDRGKLLEKLFDTTRFKSVEEWFVDRRKASADAVAEQRMKVDVLVAQVSTAAGTEAGVDDDPLDWSTRLLDEATGIAESTTAELAAARTVDRQARAAVEEARRVRGLQQRRMQACGELAELEAGAPEREALATEADRAARAAAVAAAVAEADAATRDAETAQVRARTAADRLAASGDGADLVATLSWPPSDTDRDTVRARGREWTEEVARLDTLLGEARVMTQLDRDADEMRRRSTELARRVDEIAAAQSRLPEDLAAAEQDVRAAEQAQASLPALEDGAVRAADAAAASDELVAATTTLETRRQDTATARDAHQNARQHLLDVREQRIAGMAAELAVQLVAGEPCTVCGGVDHPAPARPGAETVTKDDEDTARTAEQHADAALAQAVARLADTERAVELLTQRAGGGDRDDLRAAHTAAAAAVERARTAGGRHPGAVVALDDLRSRGARLEEQARDVAAEKTALDTRVAGCEEQAAAWRTRLSEAAGTDADVAARRTRLDALATLATALFDARDRAAALAATARDRGARVQTAVGDADFASLDDALAAVRPADRIDRIRGVLDLARDRLASTRSVLAEPDVVAVADLEPVDPSGPETAARTATAVVEAAVAAASEAETRRGRLEGLVARLGATVGTLGPILAEHAELADLADVVAGRGQNTRKMSLRSYVLAARLEEVAVSASVRLRRMSAGRYEFVHSDEAGVRGRRGGLGLDIRDDYTGVVRSAKTLSGGESFLASLALALGLADVVAAESGGVVLDTMFIDEGFGTLDADTLDLVMGVLDDLRAGGRVVGIVSHVDEMRQRIPSRLHVLHGRTGSTLEMVAG